MIDVAPSANGSAAAGGEELLLVVDGLEVQFATDRGWATVVEDVSFSIGQGETVALVGESGSGKSVTALSVLGLIETPPGRISKGSIRFDEQELIGRSYRQLSRVRGNDIAMIFQEPMTSLNPAFTVGDQVAEVVRTHRRISRRDAWRHAVEMLDRVGIPSAARRAKDYPHTFSGGMRQRVMMALALACEPRLLIADEPTTALDVTVQADMLDLLRDLQQDMGMAVLFITHDLGVVADICQRVIVMYAGQVIEQGTVDDLFARPFHPYTEGLLRSMPQVADLQEDLWSIPGVVPPAWDMPSGCRFHPRCPYAEVPRCTDQPPPLLERDGRLTRCVRIDELDLEGVR